MILAASITIRLLDVNERPTFVAPERALEVPENSDVGFGFGEAMAGILIRGDTSSDLMQAGMYGFTAFVIAVLVNVLSYWLRDYRILAEQQALDLTRLEQINELIIRRMRNGVIAVDENCDIQLMNESAWFSEPELTLNFAVSSPTVKAPLLAIACLSITSTGDAWSWPVDLM